MATARYSGRLEGRLAIVEEGLELLGGGRRDLASRRGRQDEVGRRAALVAVAVQRLAGPPPAP